MSNGNRDKVELIALLEIIFLTFIAIFCIAFISVPTLFIQNAVDNAKSDHEISKLLSSTDNIDDSGEPDYDGIESAVTRLLIFVDFALMFQLIVHTLIVIGFNRASKQRDFKKFRPWFIFNLLFVPVVLAGTIYGFVRFCCIPIAAFNHVLNIIYLGYKGWAIFTVFVYMRELKNRVVLNSEPRKGIEDD